MSFKPSEYQKAIFEHILTRQDNLVISAGPGSGKTTTIVKAAQYVPYGKSVVFVAFSNMIVEELKNRLPHTVQCTTMHKLGLRAITAAIGQVSISDNKQVKFLEKYYEKIKDFKEKWSNILACDQAMSLIRATMTALNKEAVDQMCSNYGVYINNQQTITCIRAIRDIYQYNEKARGSITIDFQDMIEICVKLPNKVRMPQFDFVFMDECQDASKLDQLFIERIIKPKGRLIAVGDEKQAIYSFRGADVQSFKAFTNRPNTVTLPLSISYRCGKNIVKFAKKIYDDIQECPTNADGQVLQGYDLNDVQEGDMILCRNLKPLVNVYFDLIRQGKKSVIYGKEIEKGLQDFLSKYEDMQVIPALNDMNSMLERLANELKGQGYSAPHNHPKYVTLHEKVLVIELIARNFEYIYEVQAKIQEIFDESMASIKLMTIHKSKGLEADNVYVIEEFENKQLIPSPYAQTSTQLLQEKNLLFVAYTRAKNKLIRVSLE